MTPKQMAQRSNATQMKKYGGKAGYKKEMSRRGGEGAKVRWVKKSNAR